MIIGVIHKIVAIVAVDNTVITTTVHVNAVVIVLVEKNIVTNAAVVTVVVVVFVVAEYAAVVTVLVVTFESSDTTIVIFDDGVIVSIVVVVENGGFHSLAVDINGIWVVPIDFDVAAAWKFADSVSDMSIIESMIAVEHRNHVVIKLSSYRKKRRQ